MSNIDKGRAIHYYLPPTDILVEYFKKDKRCSKAYRISILALNNCGKYKINSLKYRLKKQLIRDELLDNFIKNQMVYSQVVVNLKNSLIMKYHQQKNTKPNCNCRNIAFGFCFC